MKKKTKTLLTCLAVPLGVGAVSGFLTQGSMNTFEKLKQPPLTPPGWVFPVVWTGLFAMMGTASYLVAITPKTEERKKALTLYGIQLAVNFLWPVFSLTQDGICLRLPGCCFCGIWYIYVQKHFLKFREQLVI